MSFPDTRSKILLTSTILLLGLCVSVVWGILLARSALMGLVLVAAGIYVWVLFYRPFYVTLAFLFTSQLGALLNLPITQGGFSLSLAIAFTGLVAWMIKALVAKDSDLFALPLSKPVHMLMIAFLAAMAISLVNTSNLPLALAQIKRSAYYVIIYFFITYTIRDKEQLKTGFAVLLVTYFIVCGLGVLEAASGKYPYEFLDGRSLLGSEIPEAVQKISYTRLNGVMGNPEFHSFRMITFFLFLLCPLILCKSKPQKALLALVILMALINIAGTCYRGAVVGLTASLCVFLLLGKIRHKWLLLTASALLIGLIYVWAYTIFPRLDIERLAQTKGKAAGTVELRKHNTLIGLNMALDRPVLGHGPDGFSLQYHRYSRIIPEARAEKIKAHSTYVQVLAEYGLVGFSVFVPILFITLRNVLRMVRKATNSDHYITLSILAALSAHVAMMIGGNLLYDENWWSKKRF
jgi:O-antigen ligase